MTLSDEDKSILIAHRIKRADALISEIDVLIKTGYLETAANRIYYCIYYLLSAFALKKNYQTSKHLQLIGWFNREFVKAGIVPHEIGEIVYNSYDLRTKSDYDDFVVFSKGELTRSYSDLMKFMENIKKLIDKIE